MSTNRPVNQTHVSIECTYWQICRPNNMKLRNDNFGSEFWANRNISLGSLWKKILPTPLYEKTISCKAKHFPFLQSLSEPLSFNFVNISLTLNYCSHFPCFNEKWSETFCFLLNRGDSIRQPRTEVHLPVRQRNIQKWICHQSSPKVRLFNHLETR